ncbi:MAG: diguanylate cyclase [Oligoflexales bacterium]
MSDDKTIITAMNELTALNSDRNHACLIQYSGINLGARYILSSNEMVIGRADDADITINETSVSRRHVRCSLKGTELQIFDLNSSNGTFINEARMKNKHILNDGDIVRLGKIILKYFAPNNIEKSFHDKIYRLATIDAGTQIFNKKYVFDSLERQFKYSRTYKRPLSCIFFDLDHFKKVNDKYGHEAGDYILKESAKLVGSCIRKDDIFGRIGGEEFVVILPDANTKIAYEFAERIRKKISKHQFKHGKNKIHQTISLGVSELHKSMKSHTDLLADADKKLYKSKANGRNRSTM